MNILEIAAVRTTEDMYNARLAVVQMKNSEGVETLHDIFCFAIAISQYVAIIENDDRLAYLDEEEFLKMLVLAKFTDEKGNVLTGDYNVSVHFTPLGKHCIVKPDAHGTNKVFYNKEDDTPATEFELGIIAAQKTCFYEPTGEYEFLHRLQPSWPEDTFRAIELLELAEFQQDKFSRKLEVPTAFKNGRFEMREKTPARRVYTAKEIDAVEMTQFLQKHRRDIGSTAKRLCDVYGLHLLLADYEVRIKDGQPDSEMTKEQFLNFIVKTVFQSKDGRVIVPGKTISIHHQALKMHCLVKISMNGSNKAFYHKSERDDIERFLVACIHEENGTYHEGFFLKDQAHDIGALNLALEHQNFDTMTGRTLVPEKHRNYDEQMMERVKFGYDPRTS